MEDLPIAERRRGQWKTLRSGSGSEDIPRSGYEQLAPGKRIDLTDRSVPPGVVCEITKRARIGTTGKAVSKRTRNILSELPAEAVRGLEV